MSPLLRPSPPPHPTPGDIPDAFSTVVLAAGSSGIFDFAQNPEGLSPTVAVVQACNKYNTCYF